jgi:phage shock protein A
VPPATAVASPAATSDPFAAALDLIRELRQSIQGVDNDLRQSVDEIDADLAEAEASVVDAEARFRKATAQLTQLLASMDTAVARARAGLDRVRRRSN